VKYVFKNGIQTGNQIQQDTALIRDYGGIFEEIRKDCNSAVPAIM
jgi:hypothetical protein